MNDHTNEKKNITIYENVPQATRNVYYKSMITGVKKKPILAWYPQLGGLWAQ
jgi:hypothetical protein